MNLSDLKIKLAELDDTDYIVSYNEGYKTGGYVIDSFHGIWRFRFIDEKGNQEKEQLFNSEDELCINILQNRQIFHQKREIVKTETLVTPNIVYL